MKTDKISTWVGLIGGGLGLVATVGGGAVAAIAYFATRDQLVVVDCHHYYSQESLSFQTMQLQLISQFLKMESKTVAAKLTSEKEPRNTSLRTGFEAAKREQDEVYRQIQEAQAKSKAAIEEKSKCGYKGPKQF